MHHAYVIVGEETEAVQYLEKTFAITALLRHFPLLGIEEGRMIKMEQSRRLAPEKKSFIVLSCDTITIEAQNVLLKTFEEPAPNVHLFLIIPEKQNLLPTLLSRCELVQLAEKKKESKKNHPDPEEFIKVSPEDRLTMVTDFIKKHEVDDSLRRASQQFATELLKRQSSVELDRAIGYLYDRAALPRLVLEHLAMVI